MNKDISFGSFHPISAFLYFLSVIIVTMFAVNPVIIALSLIGGEAFYITFCTKKELLSDIAFYVMLFIILSLTNPLFSHNGATVLFFLNGNPVTLEAVLYGVDVAAVMIAVIIWCKCFSSVMTSDKTLYLFGRALPKLSLVLSMSLRFIPLFKQRWREIKEAQIAMGYYSEKGIVSKLMSSMRVFSALVTLSLESSVETSSSMKARGYGLKGRTYFSMFKFKMGDTVLVISVIALAICTFIAIGTGIFKFDFYPQLTELNLSFVAILCYVLFAIFAFIPFIYEITEALKWKYLRSKI